MLELVKLLTWLISPLGILAVGSTFALVFFIFNWRRLAIAAISISVLQILAFSIHPISDALFGNLENQARLLDQKSNEAQQILSGRKYAAVVLLGGGVTGKHLPMRPLPDLNQSGDRILHAARLYKRGLAPKIIVSGGRIPGLEDRSDIQSEAEATREILLEIGIPDSAIVMESASRTTRENAEKIKALMPGGKVALVTSAFHMPRAAKTFSRAQIEFDTFSSDFRIADGSQPWWERWLPSANALHRSETALKEYIALAINY